MASPVREKLGLGAALLLLAEVADWLLARPPGLVAGLLSPEVGLRPGHFAANAGDTRAGTAGLNSPDILPDDRCAARP